MNNSVGIAKELFIYNKAEYLEVLDTQREALDAKIDVLELKQGQFDAMIKLYKAIGGGWQ